MCEAAPSRGSHPVELFHFAALEGPPEGRAAFLYPCPALLQGIIRNQGSGIGAASGVGRRALRDSGMGLTGAPRSALLLYIWGFSEWIYFVPIMPLHP
jgi:hypothetical protein